MIRKTILQISKINQIRIRKYNKLSYIHNVGEEPLRPLTLGQLLEKSCAEYSSIPAVISCHQNKTMDYKELLDEADRLAAGLMSLGFQQGDKVGIWAPNMAEWFVTFMACARGGFIMVPLNPFYQKRELEYCINKAGINVLVAREENLKKQNFNKIINSIIPNISDLKYGKINNGHVPTLKNIIKIGKQTDSGTHTYTEVLDLVNENNVSFIKERQGSIKIDDPCCIQFTSGTTGNPKAPVISHFSAVNNGFFLGKRNRLNKKQHKLCIQNPLFHAYGSIIGLVGAVNHGTTVVLPSDKYDVEKNLEGIKNHKCTVVYGTPTMYVDLVNLQKIKQEKLHLEIAVSGGAVCSPHLFENMLKFLGVKQVKSIYGMTETTGSVFQSMDGDDAYKCTKTIGYLQEHLEVKVIDEQGNIVPRGAIGEMCLRGYSIMLHYYEDEIRTKECKEDSGWFHTGDLCQITDEGYAIIVGRLKDMIIRGGENIYAREIEDYLNTHPDILEAHVVGLPHKRLGEEICACLRTKDKKELTVDDIKQFCMGNIATFKIPSVIEIIELIPKTTSGKVQKNKLVEIIMKNKS